MIGFDLLADAMNCIIERSWDGQPSERGARYSVMLEIIRGDVRFKIDAPYFESAPPPPVEKDQQVAPRGRYPGLFKYECVEIFIGSGTYDPVTSAGKEFETPYLEIEVGPYGHYYMIGFLGESQWASQDDELMFEHDPEIAIDHKNRRWQAKGIIPFYLLPDPGSDEKDPLKLMWRVNCVAIHGTTPNREYLSQNQLPSLNFHQLKYFSPLVVSDKDAERLISMSRGNRGWVANSALRLKSGDFHQSSRWNSSDKSPTDKTIDQVLEEIRVRSDADEKTSSLNAKFQALLRTSLMQGEQILISGTFWKRKGLGLGLSSHKHRLLFLTSKPRIIYFQSKAPYAFRGQIEWTLLKPITISKQPGSTDRFDIALYDGTRRYHWFDDKESGAGIDAWISAVKAINVAWDKYLASNFAYRNSVATARRLGEEGMGSTAVAPGCFLL